MKQAVYQTPVLATFFPAADAVTPPHCSLIIQWQPGDEERAYNEAQAAYDAIVRAIDASVIAQTRARRAVAS